MLRFSIKVLHTCSVSDMRTTCTAYRISLDLMPFTILDEERIARMPPSKLFHTVFSVHIWKRESLIACKSINNGLISPTIIHLSDSLTTTGISVAKLQLILPELRATLIQSRN